jgi:hypothetical protein
LRTQPATSPGLEVRVVDPRCAQVAAGLQYKLHLPLAPLNELEHVVSPRVSPIRPEPAFLLRRQALDALPDVRTLEQVLQQLLGRKVFVVEEDGRWGEPVPFA